MTLSRRHEARPWAIDMQEDGAGIRREIWIESKPGKGTKVTFTIPDATKELKGN